MRANTSPGWFHGKVRARGMMVSSQAAANAGITSCNRRYSEKYSQTNEIAPAAYATGILAAGALKYAAMPKHAAMAARSNDSATIAFRVRFHRATAAITNAAKYTAYSTLLCSMNRKAGTARIANAHWCHVRCSRNERKVNDSARTEKVREAVKKPKGVKPRIWRNVKTVRTATSISALPLNARETNSRFLLPKNLARR